MKDDLVKSVPCDEFGRNVPRAIEGVFFHRAWDDMMPPRHDVDYQIPG